MYILFTHKITVSCVTTRIYKYKNGKVGREIYTFIINFILVWLQKIIVLEITKCFFIFDINAFFYYNILIVCIVCIKLNITKRSTKIFNFLS